jgi:hypothetical protein
MAMLCGTIWLYPPLSREKYGMHNKHWRVTMRSGKQKTALSNFSIRRWALALVSMLLGLFYGNSIAEAFPSADFNQTVKVHNDGETKLYIGFTQNGNVQLANVVGYTSPMVPGWTNSHSKACSLTPDGNYLIVGSNDYCQASVNWNFYQSYQMCSILPSQASMTPPSGGFYYNCSNGLANHITVVELGTGGSSASGVNYDITMIPQVLATSGINSGIACNDPQWGGCTYAASVQQTSTDPSSPDYVAGGPYYYNQLNHSQLPADNTGTQTSQTFCKSMQGVPYNFGVQLKCSSHKTFTCKGAPQLGIGFPDQCGFTKAQFTSGNPLGHKNCSGNMSDCYQAFFWPMSQGGPSAPNGKTTNGIYYCGINNPQQPQDNCYPITSTLEITFYGPSILFR